MQNDNPEKSVTKTFVVARYYFPTLFRKESNETFFDDVKKLPVLPHKQHELALGDFANESRSGHQFLKSIFGRSIKGRIGEIFDKETREFREQNLPDHVDEKIEVVFFHPKHLIFIEKSGLLRPERFVQFLKDAYHQINRFSEIAVDFIVEEKNIYKEIKEWDSVDKVVFTGLRPSNPSSDDTFDEIERLIKEANSGKTRMEFQSTRTAKGQQNGLNPDSMLIRESLALTAHGYGEAVFEGTKNGTLAKVETKRFPKTVSIKFSEDGGLDEIVATVNDLDKNEHDD